MSNALLAMLCVLGVGVGVVSALIVWLSRPEHDAGRDPRS